jgi:hypothetical protein
VAERTHLKPVLRFAALVALVLLVHGLALRWLSDALVEPALLKQMATPMFTRVLQPTEPAPIVAVSAAQAPALPRRPAITSVRKKTAPKPAKAASVPAVAPAARDAPDAAAGPAEPASAPQVEPETQLAAAPQEPASAPTALDSMAPAPQAPASASSAVSSLDTWPADTRLSYRLSGWFHGDLYGSASVQWQREGGRYQNRVEIDVPPFYWLILTSQGEVTAQGLSPQAYEEQRRSNTRAVQLDSDVRLNDGRRVPRPPGVQDTASQFVELSHRFATGQEKLEVGRHIDFWLARPNGVDLWTYDIVERKALDLRGLGVVEAFHLKPRPITNPRGNITAEIWFAPALQYLPVRIRVNMGPDTYVELMAEKIEQR